MISSHRQRIENYTHRRKGHGGDIDRGVYVLYHHLQIMGGKKRLKPLEFDWNKGNLDKNLKKHDVDFRECEEIFFNKPLKVFPDKKHSQKEKRLVAFGITAKDRKLTMIFTLRNSKIRVISARNMSRKERKDYEKN